MDRLARYATADGAVMARLLDMRAFERFRDAIAHIIAAQVGLVAPMVKLYFITRLESNWEPSHLKKVVEFGHPVVLLSEEAS